MHSRRKFIKNTGIFSAGLLALQTDVFALPSDTFNFALKDFISKRPPLAERKFTSEAVEKAIVRIKKQIANPELATPQLILKSLMENRILMSLPAISMRCGFVIVPLRSGRTFRL
jgi:hypothetical protein